jgi:hypothetical protein
LIGPLRISLSKVDRFVHFDYLAMEPTLIDQYLSPNVRQWVGERLGVTPRANGVEIFQSPAARHDFADIAMTGIGSPSVWVPVVAALLSVAGGFATYVWKIRAVRRAKAKEDYATDVRAMHKQAAHLHFDITNRSGQLRQSQESNDQITALRREVTRLASQGPEPLRNQMQRIDGLMRELSDYLIDDSRTDQGRCGFQQHGIARNLRDAINEVSTLLDNWQR